MSEVPASDHGQNAARVDLDWLAVPVIELTADAQALNANAAFQRLTGIDIDRLRGTGWYACLSPDRRMVLFAALAGAIDFELELRVLRVDGVKAWVQLAAKWVPARGSFICALHDTTSTTVAVQDAQAQVQRLSLMADNVPVLMAYYQRDGLTCAYANRQYAATFGLNPQSIVGLTFAQVIGADAARLIQPQVDVVLEQRCAVTYGRDLVGPDGTGMRRIEVNLVPHQIGDGPVMGSFVLITDVTRYRQAENAVRESEERLWKFMDASVEGIAFHRDGYITDVNAPMAALVGLTPEQLLGRFVEDFVAPEHLPRVRQGLAEGKEVPYEAAIVDREGRSIPVEIIVRSTRRGGEELRLVVVRDIRDRQAARERIRHLALHDGLTGLRNRGAFMEALEAALVQQREHGGVVALLFIDLDRFKRINDALGHLAGDALLQAVSARVAQLLPSGGVAGRFGGDEFTVLVPGLGERQRVRDLAERIRVAVSLPVEHEGRSVSVTPTIGIALYPEHGTDPDTLLRCADAAMYAGKAAGRDGIAFYEPGMGEAIDAGLKLEAELAQALARGEIDLLLQPRLRADGDGLVAVQALVRWSHPLRGTLGPADFAVAAEHSHLLQPLAAWALREALQLQRHWSDQDLCEVPMALDLGALHPHGVALAATVAHAMAEESMADGGLWLELDEQALRDDDHKAGLWLGRLQALGASVVIDEFGARGVSLARLRHLPLAGLKIDHSLIGALPGDAGACAVVQAIIVLAHGLGLTVCAAGVETEAQQSWLVQAGCEQLQGKWIQAPMTRAEMAQWLAQRRR